MSGRKENGRREGRRRGMEGVEIMQNDALETLGACPPCEEGVTFSKRYSG